MDGQASYVRVGHAWHVSTGRRKLFQMQKHLSHFLREPGRYIGAPFAIPIGGVSKLQSCSPSQSNRRQRDSTSR